MRFVRFQFSAQFLYDAVSLPPNTCDVVKALRGSIIELGGQGKKSKGSRPNPVDLTLAWNLSNRWRLPPHDARITLT